ncbi:MAG: hypothetical protein QXJ93_01565 [Candidatus Rehaiarchaeum fermentans]|nr:hypothetical protein [Candidatus Rehaiarchaeum fermentans]
MKSSEITLSWIDLAGFELVTVGDKFDYLSQTFSLNKIFAIKGNTSQLNVSEFKGFDISEKFITSDINKLLQ